MKYLRLSLCAAAVLCGAAVVAHSVLASFRLMPLIPYFDHLYLQDVFFVEAARGNEHAFWYRLTQSNEHLMLFPMPIYWLDNEVFEARGLLPVAVIQLVNLLVAALLARLAARALGLGRDVAAATFALFAAAQFWGIHGVNLFWPKQVHMYCMLAALAGGSLLYARAEHSRSVRLLAAAIGCFLVSLFSFGYGVAACCGLLGVAVCRAPWRWSATLLVLVGSGFWFYLAHMAPTAPQARGEVAGAAEWVLRLVEYVLWFLSAPPVQIAEQLLPAGAANATALSIAGVAVIGAAAFLALHLSKKGDLPPLRTFAAIWLLATLTGACITAVARVGADPSGARADRYAMIPVAFWNALLLAAASWLPPRARERGLVAAAVAVLPLLLLSHLQLAGVLAPQVRSYITAGEMAFLNEVDDPVPLLTVHPSYRIHLPRVQAGMKQRQWGVFAGPQDEWIGRPLADVLPPGGRSVRGFVQTAAAVPETPGAVRVAGWALDDAGCCPDWLVLVDREGRVAGVARPLGLPPRRIDRLIPEWSWPVGFLCPGIDPGLAANGLWVGYARADDPGALAPHAVMPDGSSAPLTK